MKFRVTDDDGRNYEVEEIIEETKDEEVIETEKEEVTDDVSSLSEDEISALKSLAAKAADLLKLLDVEAKEHEENPELVDEEIEEETDKEEIIDDEEIEEEKEEVETMPRHDSKRSYGSLENKKSHVDDSLTDEISDAWAKRYGGIK